MRKTNLSVIIPLSSLVHKAIPKRLETVQYAIKDFYRDVDEIIVVEQSLDGKYYFLPHLQGVKKIEISYPIFNKPWCLNVGVRNSKHNYVVICDADMYSRTMQWDRLLKWMQQGYLWAFGWNKLVYTNEHQRMSLLRGRISFPGLKEVKPTPGYSEGGLNVFYKPFYWEIGGMNECFQQIGGIDNSIISRAKTFTSNYPMFPALVFHMFHEQVKKSSRRERFRNIQRLKRERTYPKEVAKWLKEQAQGLNTEPLVARKDMIDKNGKINPEILG